MQAPMKHAVEPINVRDARENRGPERQEVYEALIREIAEDACVEPERYLRDTIVPEGGE